MTLRWPEVLLLASFLFSVYLVPYSKVEESFTLHAVKDLLEWRELEGFDHIDFPGAVPRSFIGPIFLAVLSTPGVLLSHLLPSLALPSLGLVTQIIIRATLALTNGASLIFFARRAEHVWRRPVANTLLLLCATQYHLVFWISRTLPNSVAFSFVVTAFGLLLEADYATGATQRARITAFVLVTFAANVLRVELAALLFPLALLELAEPRGLEFDALLPAVFRSAFISQAMSLAVDSYFWNTLVWPEGFAFIYNVIENKSAHWGVQPWHFYFSNSLPRVCHLTVPLALAGAAVDRRLRQLVFASFAFIAGLSVLGHKEWRFFMYVLPVFNLGAAVAAQSARYMHSEKLKEMIVFGVLGLNLLLLVLSTHVSLYNYPGGEALARLNDIVGNRHARVHIDAATAMLGASKFTFGPSLDVDRREDLSTPDDYAVFDYIVTAQPGFHTEQFDTVDTVNGFYSLTFDNQKYANRPDLTLVPANDITELLPYNIYTSPALAIMKNLKHKKRSAYI